MVERQAGRYEATNWRDGRAAEGAPLLREYGVNSSIEGSNPSLSAKSNKLYPDLPGGRYASPNAAMDKWRGSWL